MKNSISKALGPIARRMPRRVREIDVLRVSTELAGSDFSGAAGIARNVMLEWAERRAGGQLPREAWEHHDFEHLAGGRNVSVIRLQTDVADLWALRSEDPDKEVAGRIWTTEVIIGGEIGKRARLSLRLTVSTTESEFRIEPHIPGAILALVDVPGLIQDGRTLSGDVVSIENEDDVELLCDYLEDVNRRLPVFVLTVPEDAADGSLISEQTLAKATAGIAIVARLSADLTWVLTKRFDKIRSVFDGGVRAYLPGFSRYDDPYRHRLFVSTALREATQARACEIWLRRLAADLSVTTFRLGKDVVEFSSVRTASHRQRTNTLTGQNASERELLSVALGLVDGLEKELKDKKAEINGYIAEFEAIEDRAKAAEQENRSLIFKIRRLEEAALHRGVPVAAQVEFPQSWSELVDWIDQSYPERIVLTPAARRMIRDPKFEDVQQVARAINWLATEQHARRVSGGGSTRDEVIEAGLTNAYCGGDAYQIWWQGRRYDVDQHIKNGNARDPRRCLRIYYFWEPDLQQTVIDSLPAHRENSAT